MIGKNWGTFASPYHGYAYAIHLVISLFLALRFGSVARRRIDNSQNPRAVDSQALLRRRASIASLAVC